MIPVKTKTKVATTINCQSLNTIKAKKRGQKKSQVKVKTLKPVKENSVAKSLTP